MLVMRYLIIIIALQTLLFSKYNKHMIEDIKLLESNSSSYSFTVMGDNRDRDDVLLQIIKSSNRDKDISFIINNGDLVSKGHKKEFKHYLKLINTSHKPLLSLLGNHELTISKDDKNYKYYFGKVNFSFSFNDSYFIVFDDVRFTKMRKKDKYWLKKELKKSLKYKYRFVFIHIPLYDPRYGRYIMAHSLKNIKDIHYLSKIFDKYKVTMLFTSHIHSYFRGYWHKTPFILTAGAGAPLKDGGFFHYIKVKIRDNRVSYQIVPINIRP